jgi:hypothetical protein
MIFTRARGNFLFHDRAHYSHFHTVLRAHHSPRFSCTIIFLGRCKSDAKKVGRGPDGHKQRKKKKGRPRAPVRFDSNLQLIFVFILVLVLLDVGPVLQYLLRIQAHLATEPLGVGQMLLQSGQAAVDQITDLG